MVSYARGKSVKQSKSDGRFSKVQNKIDVFKSLLKTHLFKIAFNIEDIVIAPVISPRWVTG